jgi:hypothetical protein
MLVLRCTRKLLVRLNATTTPEATSTTRLGDWFAQPLSVGRARLVLAVSAKTLLPVVLPARNLRALGTTLPAGICEMLRACGVAEPEIADEQERMGEVAFAATNSRAVLGSMNEFAQLLQAPLRADESLLAASRWLATAPCSPLGMDRPLDATRSAFAGARSR